MRPCKTTTATRALRYMELLQPHHRGLTVKVCTLQTMLVPHTLVDKGATLGPASPCCSWLALAIMLLLNVPPSAQPLPCAVADMGRVSGGGSISTPSSTSDKLLIRTRPSALHVCREAGGRSYGMYSYGVLDWTATGHQAAWIDLLMNTTSVDCCSGGCYQGGLPLRTQGCWCCSLHLDNCE